MAWTVGPEMEANPWPNNIDFPSPATQGAHHANSRDQAEPMRRQHYRGGPASGSLGRSKGRSSTLAASSMQWVDFYPTLDTKMNSKWIHEKINAISMLK